MYVDSYAKIFLENSTTRIAIVSSTVTNTIICCVHLQSLTTMDAGNQLTYPVKYIDIGYKDDLNLNNDEAKETGYLHVETSKDSDIIDLPQKDDESIL